MAFSRFVPETLERRALLHGTGFEAFVNFQPASAAVPAGYVADTGAVFGDRGNGLSYGWDVNNAAFTRDRNSALSADQRYDTLTHMMRLGGGTKWELAVPNGTYEVRLVAGDPSYHDSVFGLALEGTLALSGTPTAASPWIDRTVTVTVNDGRLTLTSASGADNNKVCLIEIRQLLTTNG